MSDLASLTTESRNPRTEHIDRLSTLDMLTLINQDDATVAAAVASELPAIARAVDAIVARFAVGGRLFYIGAGTSGRLGVLDASECPPTFSVPPTLVQGIIAGGDSALRKSSEHTEDSSDEAPRDLTAAGFGATRTPTSLGSLGPASETWETTATPDILVGIAASGRTPYVLSAILHARSLGALTIGLSCVSGSPVSKISDIPITPITGPEVITGSTRMKAGTATKFVLNMLSTGVMIRTGAVYGNLMVNVKPTNDKLIDRAIRIIQAATASGKPSAASPGGAAAQMIDRIAATRLLHEAGSVKTAIAMYKLNLSRAAAEARLAAAGGSLARALGENA
jgi:N-acetylmuramic acid 6-phosphate etherase